MSRLSQFLRTARTPIEPPAAEQLFTITPAQERRARWLVARWKLSIRARLLLAFFTVILMLGAPYAFLIVPALQFKQQYDSIISNITTANRINGSVKQAIDAEMWDIIAGKQDFKSGRQYAILDEVDANIRQMSANTDSERGKLKLEVIRRTLQTLRSYVDQVGVQLAEGKRFDDNEVVLENIRRVSTLVEENIQDYMLFEVRRTEQQYHDMQNGVSLWAVVSGGGMAAAILFSIVAAWSISRSIYLPIKRLHDVTSTIARQDLEPLVTSDTVDEIAELGLSFNSMVGKIRELLDAKLKEQENLKKAELRVLQAQINPHFLYNTLDTIIWMAEANRTSQVVDLVCALSRFFRITLSKGKDWITIRDEVEHVESYLAIQKMRYRDILDYRIEMPDDIGDSAILKLTLQPLVENALYHGIKNKRSGGTILVRGARADANTLLIEVVDNGIGMTPETLDHVRALLDGESGGMDLAKDSGFGINNVNQRIKLYYGKQYGLTIESEYQQGTRVSLLLPLDRAS